MLRCPNCAGFVESTFSYCPVCGTRQAAPPTSAARPPGKEMPWLMPVIAVVVGVIVLIGVGAYYVVQPLPPTPANLAVSLSQPYFVGAVATIDVAYAYPPADPQALLVSMSFNGTTAAAVPMPTVSGIGGGVTVTPAGFPFRIDWSDGDYDAKLSTGDAFTITPTLTPPPCCFFGSFNLLRRVDGVLVATVSFYGPPAPAVIPVVAFGNLTHGTPTNVYLDVYYVDPATSWTYLWFQIVIGPTASMMAPIQPYGLASNVTVAGGEYIVAWYDLNSNSLLDAGDFFNITLAGGSWPAQGTLMGFYLEWVDGTTLASATWTA